MKRTDETPSRRSPALSPAWHSKIDRPHDSLRVDKSSRPRARGPRAHGGSFATPTATEGQALARRSISMSVRLVVRRSATDTRCVGALSLYTCVLMTSPQLARKKRLMNSVRSGCQRPPASTAALYFRARGPPPPQTLRHPSSTTRSSSLRVPSLTKALRAGLALLGVVARLAKVVLLREQEGPRRQLDLALDGPRGGPQPR
jgi:hypothetical protein